MYHKMDKSKIDRQQDILPNAQQLKLNRILLIGKTLEKSNPELTKKLLFNFNTYDKDGLVKMFNGFDIIIRKGAITFHEGEFNVGFILNHYKKELETLIYKNEMPSTWLGF